MKARNLINQILREVGVTGKSRQIFFTCLKSGCWTYKEPLSCNGFVEFGANDLTALELLEDISDTMFLTETPFEVPTKYVDFLDSVGTGVGYDLDCNVEPL